MKSVNVGLIGGGFMGKAHSLGYAAMPIFFWPAPAMPVRKMIADLSPAQTEEARTRLGFEVGARDWKELVESDDIDVVDIATPNDSHAEIAIAAAAAGKHIICEKPLARTGPEALRMLEAVQNAGIVHMVAFSYRHTPAIALARRLIDQGRIGAIQNFRGVYLQDWSADPDSPLSWRFNKDVAGSGALGDIGTHVIDIARYLVGEISGVNAVTKTYITERPRQTGSADKLGAAQRQANAPKGAVDVDDELMTLVRFSEGAVGSIEATRNAYGRNNYLAFEIHGSEGSLCFNYERRDELQVMFASDPAEYRGFRTIYTGPLHPFGDGLWPIPALGVGYGDTKIIETYLLMEAIGNRGAASPSFDDGYRTQLIADAILQSSEKKSWIDVVK